MLTEPPIKGDVSKRLNELLSRYLRARRIALPPLVCPPWRRAEEASPQPPDSQPEVV